MQSTVAALIALIIENKKNTWRFVYIVLKKINKKRGNFFFYLIVMF